jgi:hypothetical protein
MTRFPFFLAILSGLIVCSTTYGVIVAGGDGTGNTNDATGLIGWDYVGKIDDPDADSSVTYVGDDWFITGYHVKDLDSPTAIVFNSSYYDIDDTSWKRLTNSTGTQADLAMFKVESAVTGIPNPTIASNSSSVGSTLYLIGNGRNREASTTTWYVDTTPANWVWSTTPFAGWDATASGYRWGSGSAKRWGTNTLSGFETINYSYGIIASLYTVFDNVSGEAHGARYDSGGGVFTGTTNAWELAGIMFTLGTFNNQPSGTAVFGNRTYIADLSEYRDQIVSTIPEPLSAGIVLSMTAVAVILKRIRLWFA